jgi:hypothetical protein
MVESKRMQYKNGLSGRFCFEFLIDPAISEMKIVLLVCLNFQTSIQKVCLYIVCFIDGAGRPTLWAQYRSECRV